jgi:hypothetical protein
MREERIASKSVMTTESAVRLLYGTPLPHIRTESETDTQSLTYTHVILRCKDYDDDECCPYRHCLSASVSAAMRTDFAATAVAAPAAAAAFRTRSQNSSKTAVSRTPFHRAGGESGWSAVLFDCRRCFILFFDCGSSCPQLLPPIFCPSLCS